LKLGVVLFQLGGPDSLENIEPFLYNLFCDPDIIDFPFARIARQPLAKLISVTRARHVQHHYAEIGGRSPILEHTTRQAAALEAALRVDHDARVVVAMRYWHPFTEEAIGLLERHRPDEVVLLPMYPQYSKTTTGSSLNEWRRRFHPNGWAPRVRAIEEFHQDAAYLDAVVDTVNGTVAGMEDLAGADFVFSAHSLPVAVVERGDPYQRQIERTAELVWQRMAGAKVRVLSEQGGRVEVAAAFDARNDQASGGGESEARGGGADFVCVGPRGDAARDRYRASRAGARIGDRGLPHGAGVERLATLYRGAGGVGEKEFGVGHG
jgi:ferrochelatase